MSPLTTSLAISLALLTGAQTGLQAQAPALDAWARVDVLRPGTTIVVTLTTGERRDCRFVRSTADDLTLAFPDTGEETLPKSLIEKVAGTTLVRDSTGNGAAIGAAVGALAGLALVSGIYARCDGGCEAPAFAGPVMFSVGVGGAGGAALGWAIDHHHASEEVLFERESDPAR